MEEPEMTADAVIAVLQLLEANGIEVHVEGGWGVDALLGHQSRRHAELDIALRNEDVPKLRRLLATVGYVEVPRDDTWECNFVLSDGQGHEVDVHSYVLDAAGNYVSGVAYRAEHLTGMGSIAGRTVRCISPEWMVRFHRGYELDEKDHRDVKALCERFGVELPTELQ